MARRAGALLLSFWHPARAGCAVSSPEQQVALLAATVPPLSSAAGKDDLCICLYCGMARDTLIILIHYVENVEDVKSGCAPAGQSSCM